MIKKKSRGSEKMQRLFSRSNILYYKKSIIARILMFFTICNVILLMILGYSTITDSSKTLHNEIVSYTAKTIEQAKLNLDYNFQDIKTPLILFGANNSVVACLNSNLSFEERFEHDRNILSFARNINTLKPLISDMLIIGKNGYVNNLDGRFSLKWNYDFQNQKWFKESIAENGQDFKILGLYLQDYYNSQRSSSTSNTPTLAVSMIVRNSKNSVIGSVICNFDLNKLGNLLMKSNYEKSGDIMLVDEKGTIIAHNDKTKVGQPLKLSKSNLIFENASGDFVGDINGMQNLIIFNTTAVTGWKVVSYIPLNEIDQHSKELKNKIYNIVLWCLIINIIISFGLSLIINRPVKKLIKAINEIKDNHLTLKSTNYKYSELNQIAEKFNDLLQRIDTLIKKDYKSQILLNKFELNALQAQINPHFLFNTLQLLQTEIVYNNIEESNEIVMSLSDILRYTIYESNEIVPLETELKYIKDYLKLFFKKFDNRMEVIYDIAEDLGQYKIQKLLLQPIVENCIKHGFLNDPVDAKIFISAKEVSNDIYIIIEDNGTGIENKKLANLIRHINDPNLTENKIGLRNVNQRIKINYGDQYGLTIESINALRTIVGLLIPKVI